MSERLPDQIPDSNVETSESVREFLIPLLEEEFPTPQIKNAWQGQGKETIYRAELPHNDAACDPKSDCQGTVSIHFSKEDKGEKRSFCRGCKKQVLVSIAVLKIETQIL